MNGAKQKTRRGAEIGRARVAVNKVGDDGFEFRGVGQYCGFPIAVALVPMTHNGAIGWDIILYTIEPINEVAETKAAAA